MSCRQLCRAMNLEYHKQRCARTIQKPKIPRINIIHADKLSIVSIRKRVVAGRFCESPSCAQPSEIPSQCSNTKSKISFSYCRAQAYIFDFVFEHGKGAAHFCVCEICSYTNKAVQIEYRTNLHLQFINLTIIVFFLHPFPLLAAIHLFARSETKSKISTSPAKKLVAATSCAYNIIHSQKKNRIYRFFYKHRNLRGYFDDMRRKLDF